MGRAKISPALLLLLHQLCRPQYRCHWLDITCTPADIPRQRGAYLCLIGMRMLLQEGIRAHNKARCTVTTLSGPLLGKRLLDGIDRKSTCLNSSHGSISYAVFR